MGTNTTNFLTHAGLRGRAAALGLAFGLAPAGCFSESTSAGSSVSVGDDDDDSGGRETTSANTDDANTDAAGSGTGTTGSGVDDTGTGDTTTSGVADTSAGPTDDGSSDDGSDSGGAMDTGSNGAPTFAPCDSPGDCASGVCLLFVSAANQNNIIGGHCTQTECQNPQVDCPAPMNGSADPVCWDVSLNGDLTSVCALDCSGGAQCPTGLSCDNDVIAPFSAACL